MLGVLVAAAVMVGGVAMAENARHKDYEMPSYVVEDVSGEFEIRRYDPHLVAEVTVSGDRSAAIGQGFRVLAGYIFGGNAGGEKVAMTVPVAQAPAQGGSWVIRFMMPEAYTVDTLPFPKDQRIRFVTLPASRQVVRRFSGLPTTGALERQTEELRRWAKSHALGQLEGPFFYFYDSPMTLPWKRRNEVAFALPDGAAAH